MYLLNVWVKGFKSTRLECVLFFRRQRDVPAFFASVLSERVNLFGERNNARKASYRVSSHGISLAWSTSNGYPVFYKARARVCALGSGHALFPRFSSPRFSSFQILCAWCPFGNEPCVLSENVSDQHSAFKCRLQSILPQFKRIFFFLL